MAHVYNVHNSAETESGLQLMNNKIEAEWVDRNRKLREIVGEVMKQICRDPFRSDTVVINSAIAASSDAKEYIEFVKQHYLEDYKWALYLARNMLVSVHDDIRDRALQKDAPLHVSNHPAPFVTGPSEKETIALIKAAGVDPKDWAINYKDMSIEQRKYVIYRAQTMQELAV